MEPEHIDSVLDQANRLLEEGKPAESLRCLDQVKDQLVDSDDRIEFASLQACALADIGRSDEAVQALETLLTEFPDSAHLFGALGVVLSGSDRLERAREALEAAVALDQEDETLLANLALVYEKLRDYSTAIKLYDRAINLGADLDWGLQRKAAALSEAGDYAAAKTTLRRYLSLVPDDADQWTTLGILHSDDDEYEQAFDCYRQAERLDPDSAALRLNWGVTAVRAAQLPAAGQQLDELRRIDPDSSRPLLLQAFILEEEGGIDAAGRCYSQALDRIHPDDYAELAYATEMAMDFYARGKQRNRCEELLHRAYAANACTADLCEPYRELTGRYLRRGYWYTLAVEANYREGLREVREPKAPAKRPVNRFRRSFQVVARDHDEAVTLVLGFAARVGETGVCICEFLREEPLNDAYSGIYEVESESLVL